MLPSTHNYSDVNIQVQREVVRVVRPLQRVQVLHQYLHYPKSNLITSINIFPSICTFWPGRPLSPFLPGLPCGPMGPSLPVAPRGPCCCVIHNNHMLIPHTYLSRKTQSLGTLRSGKSYFYNTLTMSKPLMIVHCNNY